MLTTFQLVNLVLVIRNVEVEVEVKLLAVYDSCVQCPLDTLVRCGTYVLVLTLITSCRRQGLKHQQVLGCIPIEIQSTIDAATEESVIDTEVSGCCCFPLQVWIVENCLAVSLIALEHTCIHLIETRMFARSVCYAIGWRKHTRRNTVVTCCTQRETKFQVREPLVGTLHEFLGRHTPSQCC